MDNLTGLQHLIENSLCQSVPDMWLRFQPGLAVETHIYNQTGQTGSKFEMDATQILQATHLCRDHALPLAGLHFHLGSQNRDPAPLVLGIKRALDLSAKIDFVTDWTLSPGGGWSVAYHEDELPYPDPADYIRLVARALLQS